MKIVVHTVGELREALRNVPGSVRLRAEAELPDSLKRGGVHVICGDLQTVDVYADFVMLCGKDPSAPQTPALPTGPSGRRAYRRKRT